MLIDFKRIRKLLPYKPKTLLHVGGYLGEEKLVYDLYDIDEVVYVEANPVLYKKMVEIVKNEKISGPKFDFNCVPNAVSSESGLEIPFYLCYDVSHTNLGCSSILKHEAILSQCPALYEAGAIKVQTVTIDEIVENYEDISFDILNIDIEGAELLAFHGAELALTTQFDCVITEFSFKPRHKNGCTLDELDEYLSEFGFSRRITEYANEQMTWGDAVFTKDNLWANTQ